MVSEHVDVQLTNGAAGFTELSVQSLLTRGLPPTDQRIIDPEWLRGAQQHTVFLRAEDGIPVGKREYRGPWFAQENPLTCSPMAIVNACSALDISPPVRTVTKLLNEATDDEGLHFFYVQQMLLKEPTPAFTLSYMGDTHGYHQVGLYHDIFSHLAKKFIQKVESDTIILASVDSRFGRSSGPIHSGTHSIALSGYEVTLEGTVDVQVLDPDQGVYWLPLEYIANHLAHELYTLQKGQSKPVLSPRLLD